MIHQKLPSNYITNTSLQCFHVFFRPTQESRLFCCRTKKRKKNCFFNETWFGRVLTHKHAKYQYKYLLSWNEVFVIHCEIDFFDFAWRLVCPHRTCFNLKHFFDFSAISVLLSHFCWLSRMWYIERPGGKFEKYVWNDDNRRNRKIFDSRSIRHYISDFKLSGNVKNINLTSQFAV